MAYLVFLSPEAITDIDEGFEYYNSKSNGLGFEFTDVINNYLTKIGDHPTASSIRYNNVRVKPLKIFPYVIHYIIDESAKNIIVVRIFNTWKEPFWENKNNLL